jgi:hypothetical protein
LLRIYIRLQRLAEDNSLIGLTLASNYNLYLMLRTLLQGKSKGLVECQWEFLSNLNLDSRSILDLGGANSLFSYKLALNRNFIAALTFPTVTDWQLHRIVTIFIKT